MYVVGVILILINRFWHDSISADANKKNWVYTNILEPNTIREEKYIFQQLYSFTMEILPHLKRSLLIHFPLSLSFI